MEDNYKNNMVFGIHPVLELTRSQKEIEKVYVQAGTRSPEISEIANFCRANNIPVQYVPMEKMNRLTRKTTKAWWLSSARLNTKTSRLWCKWSSRMAATPSS